MLKKLRNSGDSGCGICLVYSDMTYWCSPKV